MKAKFEIAGRPVGPGNPVFVIAEAGVNHDGDAGKARALIDAATDAGADCVKFQTFKAERLALRTAAKAGYQIETTGAAESQLDMLRGLELPDEALPGLIAHAEARGIVFLSTPYSHEDVDLLVRLGLPALKLASLHMAEPAFLAYAAATGKPLIVSTGMADMAEIEAGVAAMRGAGSGQFALLQCTTDYPADPAEANLRVVAALAGHFGAVTGYSDHTPGDTSAIAAVALGASIIEKHMTLDRNAPGPDHRASLEPQEMARFVRAIREAEAALGDGIKRPTASELKNRTAMRRSLVAARDIAAGETIAAEMVTFMRPGDGIPVAEYERVIGCKVIEPIAAGTQLRRQSLRSE